METKNPESQAELFEEFSKGKIEKSRLGLRGYDDKFKLTLKLQELITGVIGFVAALIIVYSIGVERGRLSEYRNSLKAAMLQPHSSTLSQSPSGRLSHPSAALKPLVKVQAVSSAFKEIPAGSFMVRLATYRSLDTTSRAASALKTQGYPASFERKGDYYLVSLGPYIKLDEAKRLLAHLKKKYPDAYIKKK